MCHVLRFSSFNESFLSGNYAPIYHTTKFKHIVSILTSNELTKSPIGSNNINPKYKNKLFHGVSTTRDISFWYIDHIRLVLNQDLIRQDFPILPYNYSTGKKEEMEESVLATIAPLSKYLLEIQFPMVVPIIGDLTSESLAELVFQYTAIHSHVKVKMLYHQNLRVKGSVYYHDRFLAKGEYVTNPADFLRIGNLQYNNGFKASRT